MNAGSGQDTESQIRETGISNKGDLRIPFMNYAPNSISDKNSLSDYSSSLHQLDLSRPPGFVVLGLKRKSKMDYLNGCL